MWPMAHAAYVVVGPGVACGICAGGLAVAHCRFRGHIGKILTQPEPVPLLTTTIPRRLGEVYIW